ncbi:MAG: PRC-barrel domain-containing protein [Thermodesulfobacteriota bacterium]
MKKVRILGIGWIVLMMGIAMPVFAQAGEKKAASDVKTETMQTESGQALGGEALRASEMMGKTVQDQAGNEVGKIGDLIIGDSGRIAYMVLAQGGVLGIGEKMMPVPWGKIESQTEDALTLAVDEETLQQAPTFSSNEWETFSRQDWEQTVRGYYGKESSSGEQPGTTPTKEMEDMQKEDVY